MPLAAIKLQPKNPATNPPRKQLRKNRLRRKAQGPLREMPRKFSRPLRQPAANRRKSTRSVLVSGKRGFISLAIGFADLSAGRIADAALGKGGRSIWKT